MVGINSSNFGLFFDLVNLLLIIFIVIIATRINIINRTEFYLISLFAATPLFGNDILFNFWIFPDQSKYIITINLIRENFLQIISGLFIGDLTEFDEKFNAIYGNRFKPMKYASFVMASVPVPFIETVRSPGFLSKFIFIIWFLYLIYNEKKFGDNKIYIYFLLLSPSILIYSSLALKEIFIFTFFHLCMFFIITKKPFFFLVPFAILFLLRDEAAYLTLIFGLSYIYFFSFFSEKKISILKQQIIKLIILIILMSILLIFYDSLIIEGLMQLKEKINSMKLGYYSEGDLTQDISFYGTSFDFATLLNDFIKASISPIFSKSDSTFLLLFIIENIVILIIFTWYLIKILSFDKLKVLFYLAMFFLFNASVGIIVINDFAIYRYKITMIIPLILIMRQEILKYKNENSLLHKP